MNRLDKLDKLEENLSRKMGLDEDDIDNYIYCFFSDNKICVRRTTNGEDGDTVEAVFSDNWSLEDWKTFRDRCLQQLR